MSMFFKKAKCLTTPLNSLLLKKSTNFSTTSTNSCLISKFSSLNLGYNKTLKYPTANSLSLGSTSFLRFKSVRAQRKEEDTRTPLIRTDGQFKSFKPTTPGLRFRRMPLRDHLFKGKPLRKLTIAKRKTGGRNNSGRITTRHRGGGHKQRIRIIDFHRKEPGQSIVERLEYDPGRSAHIALIKNLTSGTQTYIVAPQGLEVGMLVESFMTPKEKTQQELDDELAYGDITRTVPINVGNCMPLKMAPVGTIMHCLGLKKDGPGQMARSAGTWAQLVATGETGYAQLKLGSGEIRKVSVHAIGTVGKVSNPNHQHRVLGKAGARRRLGWRPSVRGMAMNPRDHPHGGGRGKSKGNRQPTSPWGVLAKGGKTRTRPNKMVVKARPRR